MRPKANLHASRIDGKNHYLSASIRTMITVHPIIAFHAATSRLASMNTILDQNEFTIATRNKHAAAHSAIRIDVPTISPHVHIDREPKTRNHVVVHTFDPNGKVPTKMDFPTAGATEKAVASCLEILFSRCESVFQSVTIKLHDIPNFNMPGAALETECRTVTSTNDS